MSIIFGEEKATISCPTCGLILDADSPAAKLWKPLVEIRVCPTCHSNPNTINVLREMKVKQQAEFKRLAKAKEKQRVDDEEANAKRPNINKLWCSECGGSARLIGPLTEYGRGRWLCARCHDPRARSAQALAEKNLGLVK